jgi:hypothetical protein
MVRRHLISPSCNWPPTSGQRVGPRPWIPGGQPIDAYSDAELLRLAQWIRSDVEVKWGIHPAGETRPEWTADDQRTTLVLLVEGNFRIDLTEATVNLARQGDYAMWGPGIDHSWEALTDSIVLTVRWPSSPS